MQLVPSCIDFVASKGPSWVATFLDDMILTVFNPYTVRREVATAIGTPEGTNGHSRPLLIDMHDYIVQAFRVTLDLKQKTRDR